MVIPHPVAPRAGVMMVVQGHQDGGLHEGLDRAAEYPGRWGAYQTVIRLGRAGGVMVWR